MALASSVSARLGLLVLLGTALGLTAAVQAAINPDEFRKVASDHYRLRQIARIEETDRPHNPTWRRVSIVAEIVAIQRSSGPAVGDTIVIDWTVDLAALARARARHQSRPPMPGPQFMSEPEPPPIDEHGEFAAHLAPAGGRLGNVQRHAGARPAMDTARFTGPVFVPVAGQYSFQPAASR